MTLVDIAIVLNSIFRAALGLFGGVFAIQEYLLREEAESARIQGDVLNALLRSEKYVSGVVSSAERHSEIFGHIPSRSKVRFVQVRDVAAFLNEIKRIREKISDQNLGDVLLIGQQWTPTRTLYHSYRLSRCGVEYCKVLEESIEKIEFSEVRRHFEPSILVRQHLVGELYLPDDRFPIVASIFTLHFTTEGKVTRFCGRSSSRAFSKSQIRDARMVGLQAPYWSSSMMKCYIYSTSELEGY